MLGSITMRRHPVKSAARVLEVLELFSERRCPLRLHDIHSALDYPQSSTTNLLKGLVMTGYLNYNRATRAYLPTSRVTFLGGWLISFLYGQDGYKDLLDELLMKTNETVVIATQNDLYIQYVRIRTPDHEFKLPPPEGTMRLLTSSSAGFALLSQLSDRQVDKICRSVNYYGLDPAQRVEPSRVLKEAARVRQMGYCYIPNHPVPAVSSIAFPLGEQIHGIPLAIGVGGFSERISERRSELVEIFRKAIADFKKRSSGSLSIPAAKHEESGTHGGRAPLALSRQPNGAPQTEPLAVIRNS
jgi:IclR family transcriptional regulator, KDG regulon repressor